MECGHGKLRLIFPQIIHINDASKRSGVCDTLRTHFEKENGDGIEERVRNHCENGAASGSFIIALRKVGGS